MNELITQVGDATLYCGDCLEVLPQLSGGGIHMVLTDPPFGTTSRNEWDKAIPMEAVWRELKRIRADNAPTLLFSQLPFAADLVMSNRKEYRYDWIYHKGEALGFLNANRMPMRAHEEILVFYKRLPKYNPQFTQGKPYFKGFRKPNSTDNYGVEKGHISDNPDGKRYPRDVLEGFSQQRGYHPTQKPTDLLRYLIRTYTDEGDTVLDYTMGSGSTCVAALQEGRKCIGIEMDKKYYDIAVMRCKEALKDDNEAQGRADRPRRPRRNVGTARENLPTEQML